jgi:ubiquinone/menaquinone biosynthesis C-methylase UbiE
MRQRSRPSSAGEETLSVTGPDGLRDHKADVQAEFGRAAAAYAERTEGRFDALDVAAFSRVASSETVLEVGAGTGNFLALFAEHSARRVALDLTHGMLAEAGRRDPNLTLVQADGARLPFPSRSVDLVASAQALHHIQQPLPVLMEMRRVSASTGRVLIVDQIATESYEQLAFMNELEALRDPSHASSRPASVMRMLMASAGLEIVDEQIHEERSRLSKWMWPAEFPPERIERVQRFIELFGHETGMDFERAGDDWTFTRRRMMILARRA